MAILIDYWKSLRILKEIRKHSDKSLHVWTKNQLRFEFSEKSFKFTYKNLNGKLIFTHFLSHLSGLLSFDTPLEPRENLGAGLRGSSTGLAFVGGGSGACINPGVLCFGVLQTSRFWIRYPFLDWHFEILSQF